MNREVSLIYRISPDGAQGLALREHLARDAEQTEEWQSRVGRACQVEDTA